MIASRSDVDREKSVPALRIMFGAEKEYILAFYREAERQYGDFDGFLREAMGVDREMRERFSELYLI